MYLCDAAPSDALLQDREDTVMAVDERDDASDESYSFALNNLQDAVNGNTQEKMNELRRLGRRPSLSTLVIVRLFVRRIRSKLD